MSIRGTILLGMTVALLLGCAGMWLLHLATPEGRRAVRAPAAQASRSAGESAPAAIPVALIEPESGFPVLQAKTPAQVRELLRFTRAATLQDRAALIDAALSLEDPLVVGSAVRALGRLAEFNRDPRLLALISDPRPRVRQDAVIACGLDGDAAAIPHLEQVLVAGDASLRPLALEALGRIGGSTAERILQRVATDSGSADIDRVFARSALARR